MENYRNNSCFKLHTVLSSVKKGTLLYSVHPAPNPQQLTLATHDIQPSTSSWPEGFRII